MRVRPLSLLAPLVAFIVSCANLLGLDAYDSQPGGGGSNSSGGAGGEPIGGAGGEPSASSSGGAGGENVVHASDWTQKLTAVYTFDQPGDLGYDDSSNDHPLGFGDMSQPPSASMASPPQGTFALDTTNAASPALFSNDVDFEVSPATTSMTFGAWVRVASGALGMNVFSRATTGLGYALAYDPAGKPACYIDNQGALGNSGSWQPNTWTHVVCRWTVSSTLDLLTNGVPGASTSVTPGTAPQTASFEISPSALPYDGLVDEVFFHVGRLDNTSIARIYACGIDGTLCTCDSRNPSAYQSCGRLTTCINIAPCDQPSPT